MLASNVPDGSAAIHGEPSADSFTVNLKSPYSVMSGLRPLHHYPIEGLGSWLVGPIATVRFRLLRLLRLLADKHLVEQLPDEPERVHLVIMFAGGEAQQLGSKV